MMVDPNIHSNDYLTYYSKEKLNSILNESEKETTSIELSLDIKLIKLTIKENRKKQIGKNFPKLTKN